MPDYDDTLDLDDIVIDLTAIEEEELLPVGYYNIEVVKATPGISKAQHPKINLQCEVLGGEYADRIVFDTLSFAPRAMARFTKPSLIGLGFPNFKGSIVELAMELVGTTAACAIAVQAGQGTDPLTKEVYPDSNRIRRYAQGTMNVEDLLD